MNFKALIFAMPLTLAAQQHMIAPKETHHTAPAPEMSPSLVGKTTILIQAKARSEDLVKAYEFLKKEKPTYRISVRLANKQIISNVLEMTAMPNGTLFIFKSSTPQGATTQIVSIEEIVDFFYS